MKHNIIQYHDPRQRGEALWESWIGADIYEGIKKESEIEFAALYQQSPTTAEGNIFKAKHFKYYKENEDFIYLADEAIKKRDLRIYQTIDPAGTVSQTADDFACITFAIHGNNIIILDTFNEQAMTNTHSEIMSMLRDKWEPICQAVEYAGFGRNIVDNAKAYAQNLLEETNYKIFEKSDIMKKIREFAGDSDKRDYSKTTQIMPIETGGKNKIYRAEPLQVHFKNGLVWFKNGFSALEKQLLEFPNGKHDDLVDCLAYACLLLLEKNNTLTIADIYGD